MHPGLSTAFATREHCKRAQTSFHSRLTEINVHLSSSRCIAPLAWPFQKIKNDIPLFFCKTPYENKKRYPSFPPRSLVCGGQPSPHKPRLVVSHSTCPPLSSSPHAHSFVLGTATSTASTARGHRAQARCSPARSDLCDKAQRTLIETLQSLPAADLDTYISMSEDGITAVHKLAGREEECDGPGAGVRARADEVCAGRDAEDAAGLRVRALDSMRDAQIRLERR